MPPALEIGAPGLILVPVIDISRLTSVVLARAVELGGEVRALHVAFEGEPTDSLEARWQTRGPGVPLIVVPSPQRSVVRAFLAYLATPEVAAHQNVLVLIGETEPRKLRHRLLLSQRGAILATALRRRTNALVATVPIPARVIPGGYPPHGRGPGPCRPPRCGSAIQHRRMPGTRPTPEP